MLPPSLTSARSGQRWVIRHRLADGSASDLIGWLVDPGGADPEILSLDTADGVRHEVAADRVIAARRAPAAAGAPDPRRIGPDELERHALTGWLARSEAMGDWTLRSGDGFTGRANSCLAVGEPDRPIPAAAQRIIDHAAAQGINPMAQVIIGSGPEQELRALGWVDTYVPTEVLAIRLADLLGDQEADPGVIIEESLTADWLAAYHRSRPNQADPAVLQLILAGHPPRALASIRDDSGISAIARGHRSGPWLGLASIWTDPEHRRRGHATTLIIALGHWAARQGARYGYLQVASANQSAIAAYERMGFRPHHRYGYLAPG